MHKFFLSVEADDSCSTTILINARPYAARGSEDHLSSVSFSIILNIYSNTLSSHICWPEKVFECNVSIHNEGCMAVPSCQQIRLDSNFTPLAGHVLNYKDHGLMLSFS